MTAPIPERVRAGLPTVSAFRLLLWINEAGVALALAAMTAGWHTPAVLGGGVALLAGAAILKLDLDESHE